MYGVPQGSGQSRWQAIVLSVGTAALIVTTLTDLLDFIGQPLHVIAGVLSLAVIAFALHFMIRRPAHLRDRSFFIAAGSIVCAVLVLVITITSVVTLKLQGGHEASSQESPSIPGVQVSKRPTSAPTPAPKPISTPPAEAPARYSGEFTLLLETGVDLDVAAPQVVEAQAAAGKIDIALKYYGNLHATGKGWYLTEAGDRASCLEALTAPRGNSEVAGVVGAKYCFRTSDGYPAYMEVANSTFLGFSGPKKVGIAVTVWDK